MTPYRKFWAVGREDLRSGRTPKSNDDEALRLRLLGSFGFVLTGPPPRRLEKVAPAAAHNARVVPDVDHDGDRVSRKRVTYVTNTKSTRSSLTLRLETKDQMLTEQSNV